MYKEGSRFSITKQICRIDLNLIAEPTEEERDLNKSMNSIAKLTGKKEKSIVLNDFKI